jgi:hypothetical protein
LDATLRVPWAGVTFHVRHPANADRRRLRIDLHAYEQRLVLGVATYTPVGVAAPPLALWRQLRVSPAAVVRCSGDDFHAVFSRDALHDAARCVVSMLLVWNTIEMASWRNAHDREWRSAMVALGVGGLARVQLLYDM